MYKTQTSKDKFSLRNNNGTSVVENSKNVLLMGLSFNGIYNNLTIKNDLIRIETMEQFCLLFHSNLKSIIIDNKSQIIIDKSLIETIQALYKTKQYIQTKTKTIATTSSTGNTNVNTNKEKGKKTKTMKRLEKELKKIENIESRLSKKFQSLTINTKWPSDEVITYVDENSSWNGLPWILSLFKCLDVFDLKKNITFYQIMIDKNKDKINNRERQRYRGYYRSYLEERLDFDGSERFIIEKLLFQDIERFIKLKTIRFLIRDENNNLGQLEKIFGLLCANKHKIQSIHGVFNHIDTIEIEWDTFDYNDVTTLPDSYYRNYRYQTEKSEKYEESKQSDQEPKIKIEISSYSVLGYDRISILNPDIKNELKCDIVEDGNVIQVDNCDFTRKSIGLAFHAVIEWIQVIVKDFEAKMDKEGLSPRYMLKGKVLRIVNLSKQRKHVSVGSKSSMFV